MRVISLWLAVAAAALPVAARADPVAAAPGAAPSAAPGATPRTTIEVGGAAGDAAAPPVALVVSATGETLTYPLQIEEVGGAAADRVELSVTPLTDDRGAQHALTWSLDGETVEHSGRAVVAQPAAASTMYTVVFRASLPELGTYKASITPFWGGVAHQKLTLTVTRARPTLNLDVRDPDAIAQTGDLDKIAFGTVLEATEDRGVSLTTPVLRSLVEVRGADASARRLFAPGALTVKDGNAVLAANADLELHTRAVRSLGLELSGLPGPGHYEATIRFASLDAPPLDKTFAIYLRERGWVACAWIFAGVVLSWFLRWFVMNERPRVASQQAVLALIADLKDSLELPDIDADGRSLVVAVRSHLRSRLVDFLARVDAQDAKRIEVLTLKVQLVRKWLVLQPLVRTIASPVVCARHQNTLGAIAGHLRDRDASEDTLKADATTLDGLPQQLRTDIDKDLADRAAALRSDLKLAVANLPAGALRTQLRKIELRLEAGGAASFDLLVGAQKDFVIALVSDLLRRLDHQPVYVKDAAQWWQTVAAVRQLLVPVRTLEPAAAREAYRVAYAELLDRLSAAEDAVLDGLRGKLDDKLLAPLRERHDAIAAALAAGKLEEADRLIAALGAELSPTAGGGPMDGGQGQGVGLVAQPAVPELPEFSSMSPFHAPTLDQIEDVTARRVRRAPALEVLVNAVVLATAVVLGMKFLYFDDLTWGGWSGYVTAALWGLGLHQFTYGGVGGVFDRLLGGTSSAGAAAA